jgi:RNA polymerase sigma-70 factor (ECF subfamily)
MQRLIEEFREKRLITAAKRGDRAAFDSLCRIHHKGVHAYLYSRAPSQRVDDIVQDVWLTSWERISSFAGRSSYRSWVLGIAVNKMREDYRKSGPYSEEYNEQVVDANEHSISESNEVILRVTVRDALTKLPEPQRDVIDLYYYSGLSLPEIASSLGRNLNTVKYQFYAAHDKVATLLDF